MTCNSEDNTRSFCTWPDCDCGKKKSQKFSRDVRFAAYRATSKDWREIGGRRFFFRSLWEMNFARVLDFHKRTCTPFFDVMITRWEYEPMTFYFDPEQARKTNDKFGTKLKGIRKGATSYKPDFQIVGVETELIKTNLIPDLKSVSIWFEVKGYMKPKDQTKINRFRKYFPDHRIEIIGADWFTFNAQTYRALIPAWEVKGE